jgi:hypothetical protein
VGDTSVLSITALRFLRGMEADVDADTYCEATAPWELNVCLRFASPFCRYFSCCFRVLSSTLRLWVGHCWIDGDGGGSDGGGGLLSCG